MKKCGNSLAISSLSCETDFVTGTDQFRKFLNNLLDLTLEHKQNINISEYNDIRFKNRVDEKLMNLSINEGITNLISNTQENCKINFMEYIKFNPKDVFGYYLHLSPFQNIGVKAAYFVILKHIYNIL